jgi:hypothetical protein
MTGIEVRPYRVTELSDDMGIYETIWVAYLQNAKGSTATLHVPREAGGRSIKVGDTVTMVHDLEHATAITLLNGEPYESPREKSWECAIHDWRKALVEIAPSYR